MLFSQLTVSDPVHAKHLGNCHSFFRPWVKHHFLRTISRAPQTTALLCCSQATPSIACCYTLVWLSDSCLSVPPEPKASWGRHRVCCACHSIPVPGTVLGTQQALRQWIKNERSGLALQSRKATDKWGRRGQGQGKQTFRGWEGEMNCNKGKGTHGEKDKESRSNQQYRLITAEKVKSWESPEVYRIEWSKRSFTREHEPDPERWKS